jgi:hypothetical protein
MRWILLALPIPLFALASIAPAQQPAKAFESAYYPLKVGQEATYRTGEDGKGEPVVIRVERTVPLEFMRDGKEEKVTGFVLRIGKAETTEQVAVLSDGVYRFAAAGKTYKPPILFFKISNDVVNGGSWKVETKADDGKLIHGTFVGGTEPIDINVNGKLETKVTAIKIRSKDFRIDDQPMVMESWFVKDMGLVKQHVKIGKIESTLQLEKLKQAK